MIDRERSKTKGKAKLFFFITLSSGLSLSISLKFTPGQQAGVQADTWQLDAIIHDKLPDLVFSLTLVSPWTLAFYNRVCLILLFHSFFISSIYACSLCVFNDRLTVTGAWFDFTLSEPVTHDWNAGRSRSHLFLIR